MKHEKKNAQKMLRFQIAIQDQFEEEKELIDMILRSMRQIFKANLIVQDLYIDISKHRDKMHFKTIRNIYNTLTENKASQIIFTNQRATISNFKFEDKSTIERMRWRIIEKVMGKISYFMINEKNLKVISKNIFKMIDFNDKVIQMQPEDFQHNFKNSALEILNKMIEENAVLQKKIYELLLQRGYIDSMDEFYRLNRFQGPEFKYLYSNEGGIPQEQEGEIDNILSQQQIIYHYNKFRQRKLKKYQRCPQQVEMKQLPILNKKKKRSRFFEEKYQKPQISISHLMAETFVDDSFIDQQNKLTYAIHSKLEKTMAKMLVISQKYNKKNDSKNQEQLRITSMAKNMFLKNFIANQNIVNLTLDDNLLTRKNSAKSSNGRLIESNFRQRTSIMKAISKMKENQIFKSQLGIKRSKTKANTNQTFRAVPGTQLKLLEPGKRRSDEQRHIFGQKRNLLDHPTLKRTQSEINSLLVTNLTHDGFTKKKKQLQTDLSKISRFQDRILKNKVKPILSLDEIFTPDELNQLSIYQKQLLKGKMLKFGMKNIENELQEREYPYMLTQRIEPKGIHNLTIERIPENKKIRFVSQGNQINQIKIESQPIEKEISKQSTDRPKTIRIVTKTKPTKQYHHHKKCDIYDTRRKKLI